VIPIRPASSVALSLPNRLTLASFFVILEYIFKLK